MWCGYAAHLTGCGRLKANPSGALVRRPFCNSLSSRRSVGVFPILRSQMCNARMHRESFREQASEMQPPVVLEYDGRRD
jgi:hypothetical protein